MMDENAFYIKLYREMQTLGVNWPLHIERLKSKVTFQSRFYCTVNIEGRLLDIMSPIVYNR